MKKIFSGIMGLCVADALGVPVEFESREILQKNPVTNMRGFGTYNQPIGTWSDDTSMTLCLAESLIRGLDYTDIMTNFMAWFDKAEFTPHEEVFDVGIATRKALMRFAMGTKPLECGGQSEYDNGNGSLMRILPIAFYLHANYEEICDNDEAMEIIHHVSSLTHAHKRSQIACGIYTSIAILLMKGVSLDVALNEGIHQAIEYYKKHSEYVSELNYFSKLSSDNFAKTNSSEIKSSGYVVDTLEAAIWCLWNTDNYQECVLKAVNLGEDTDTVAAVAGGLAGLYYGIESIPHEWMEQIVKRGYVESICSKLYEALIKSKH